MKTRKLSVSFLLFIILLINTTNSYSQWQNDYKYKFKINIPSDWTIKSHIDGSDKIYDYSSADQNVAIQLRVFEAGEGVTNDLLIQIYEQNILSPAGVNKISLVDHTSVNGIPGKQGTYSLIQDGTEISLGTFYTVQNNIAYVLTVIIPNIVIDQKGPEIREITQSFIIDGFQSTNNIVKEEKQTTGLNGLLGGITQNNPSSVNTGVGENEITITGDKINGTYKFSKSGSYPIKWNETVVIRGLDNSGTNALELYLYNNKGTGAFTYGLATNGIPTFTIGAVNGKAVDSSPDGSSTGFLTVTEYNEGGMIKATFNAHVNGHDIKGSFSLPLSTPKDYGGYDL